MAISCKTTERIYQQMDNTHMARPESSPIATLHSLLSLPAEMELSQIELIYRAEGNANLVLALPQFEKVLRLPKSAIPSPLAKKRGNSPDETDECNLTRAQAQSKQQPHKQTEKTSVSTKDDREDLTMEDFANYISIFRQLLGPTCVLETDICWIHQETDRKWINQQIRSSRPAHRLDKEFCGQFGLLLPDATQLPSQQADILHSNLQPEAKINESTYAIEIKPKQGWKLFSSLGDEHGPSKNIESSDLDMKSLFGIRSIVTQSSTSPSTSSPTAAKVARTTEVRCRYCAMQFLKLKNHKISHMNTYCPIELFSGIPSRMLGALDALFRCPQNNLRVFKNGILIYGDHASSISYDELRDKLFPGTTFNHIKTLLVECLLRNYDNSGKDSEIIETEKAFASTDASLSGQPHSSVEKPKVSNKLQETAVKKIKMDPEVETKASTPKNQTVKVKISTSTTKTTTTTTLPVGTIVTTAKTSIPFAQVKGNDAEIYCLPKNCILQKILKLQLLVKDNLYGMRELWENYTQKTYKALRSLLLQKESLNLKILEPKDQYILGATALDCSIMITFQEIPLRQEKPTTPDEVLIKEYERNFLTKVTILDLDPKPDSHYHKYIQQTREAYEEASKS